jgi:hypothetical protein
VIAIALVRSALCDLMPRTEALPGVVDTDVTAFLRAMRRESTGLYWLGVVIGAVVYALTPLLTVGWPLPARLLPARVRDLHAQRVVSSDVYLVRQAVFLLRLSAGMCWGMHPSVRARFALPAYPPDPGTVRVS